MPVLSIQEIYQAARDAGFAPHEAVTWTAIALAESGGRTNALADHGEHSEGLWQINVAGGVRGNTFGNLYDPEVNARAAYEISHHGTDMRPWTTTHDSNKGTSADYRRYLDDVSDITGYSGDGRGVGGYGSPLPAPLPPSQPTGQALTPADPADLVGNPGGHPVTAQLDLATDPKSNLDTDHDGLTDAFERMIGTSATLADTDADGLSDAYEVAVSRTNPLSADTDQDTVTDSTEVAVGTSATTWDTDSDGASDGAELKYGT